MATQHPTKEAIISNVIDFAQESQKVSQTSPIYVDMSPNLFTQQCAQWTAERGLPSVDTDTLVLAVTKNHELVRLWPSATQMPCLLDYPQGATEGGNPPGADVIAYLEGLR